MIKSEGHCKETAHFLTCLVMYPNLFKRLDKWKKITFGGVLVVRVILERWCGVGGLVKTNRSRILSNYLVTKSGT